MLYYCGRALAALYMILFHRIKIEGRENIPETGPVLIFANHPSAFDMVLIGARMKRKIHFMAKAELFENPFIGFLLRGLAAFPVHRGRGDAGSVKNALALLEKGEIVGIFPEGTRTQKKNTERKKGGAALIAITRTCRSFRLQWTDTTASSARCALFSESRSTCRRQKTENRTRKPCTQVRRRSWTASMKSSGNKSL